MIRPLLIAASLAVAQEARVDYKVVTWYDRANPVATFQYRGYDVRKGEYTPAVDAWLELMRRDHPNFQVVVQDVDLAREPGPTEARKVGAVIHRELLAAAAAEGLFLGSSAGTVVGKAPREIPFRPLLRPGPYGAPAPMVFDLNPAPYSFPVPMPYPRPHP